jgi:hypothetical protein
LSELQRHSGSGYQSLDFEPIDMSLFCQARVQAIAAWAGDAERVISAPREFAALFQQKDA